MIAMPDIEAKRREARAKLVSVGRVVAVSGAIVLIHLMLDGRSFRVQMNKSGLIGDVLLVVILVSYLVLTASCFQFVGAFLEFNALRERSSDEPDDRFYTQLMGYSGKLTSAAFVVWLASDFLGYRDTTLANGSGWLTLFALAVTAFCAFSKRTG